MAGLPINLEDLLYARGVEDARRELKAGWDDFTAESAVRTICAFANDILNLNGGYLIIGVEEDEQGRLKLPPRGVDDQYVDRILKEIQGQCNRIRPAYLPGQFVERYHERTIIVVRATAGESKPYSAPRRRNEKEYAYFVRYSNQTIEAQGDIERQLIEMTARTPFDDRRNYGAKVTDISPSLVRRCLSMVRSQLADEFDALGAEQIYRQCGLTAPVNGHEVPRNVALLMFNEEPHRFFRGAVTEVTEYPSSRAGNDFREQYFRGPLPEQLRQTLVHLKSFNQTILRKRDYKPEVDHIIGYPEGAIEEALGNAYYHRSYDEGEVEPTKVDIFPDRIEITSYPGPVLNMTRAWFDNPEKPARITARNRRLGEFFKELKIAEKRFTGIPKIIKKMEQNGSPKPEFDFDEQRTYFRVTLHAHPEFQLAYAFQEADRLASAEEHGESLRLLLETQKHIPSSPELALRILNAAARLSDASGALAAYERFHSAATNENKSLIAVQYANWLGDHASPEYAERVLASLSTTELELSPSGAASAYSKIGLFEDALRFRRIAAEKDPRQPFLKWNWAIEAIRASAIAQPERATELCGLAEQLALALLHSTDARINDWMRARLWRLIAEARTRRNASPESAAEALTRAAPDADGYEPPSASDS